MKATKHLILFALLIFSFTTTHAQITDTMWAYPNPFETTANIHFETAQNDTISLKIIDISGQTIKTFFQNTPLPSGSYSFQWIANNTPEGMYFVSLKIGTTKTINKRLLKIGNATTAINELTTSSILPYPNPTTDLLNIPQEGNKIITIFNITGQVIKTFQTDQQIMSLKGLPNALYNISVSTPNLPVTTYRIIVANSFF